MNDDYRRKSGHFEIPPPAPTFEPELPTGIRLRPHRRSKKCAKAYLADDSIAACALLRDILRSYD